MSTSVVVVAIRDHQWLAASIESVSEQASEVVVVDNGSPDAGVSAKAKAAGARVVRLDENRGFAAGVNAGVDAARGDVIALLNDDAMAERGWLASALPHLGLSDVAAVAPKMLFARRYGEIVLDDEPKKVGADPRWLGRAIRSASLGDEDVLAALVGPGVHRLEHGELDGVAGPWRWTAGPRPFYVPLPDAIGPPPLVINGEEVAIRRTVRLVNNAGSYLSAEGFGGDYGYRSADDGQFDEPAERFAACGGALVARAETFRSVGPWAESFFLYYEDLDWSWRARLAGLRVLYEPAGVVHHVGSLSTGGPENAMVQRLAERNRLLCVARNAPLTVARREVRKATGPARAAYRRLPAALAWRAWTRRRRAVNPWEVWQRWAGADNAW